MVGVIKKLIIATLFLLIGIGIVYSEPIVTINVAGIPEIAKLSKIKEEGLSISILFNCTECEKIVRNSEYLEIYVVKEPQRIIYQDIIGVNINKNRVLYYYLPPEIFKEEGIYYIRFTYRALSNLGSEVIANKELLMQAIEIEYLALKILGIYPDLEREIIFRFDRVPYTFRIEVFNSYEETALVNVKIRVLDKIGRIVLSRTIDSRIYSFQRTFIEIPVDFSLLMPGEYTLVLTVNYGPYEIYEVRRTIIIGEEFYVPVRIYNIKHYPFVVRSGDFVEFNLLLRNIENKPVKAKVLLVSRELGIYRESETIEFDPLETKNLKFVVKIPENIEPRNYSIEFIVQHDVATYRQLYRLYVEGEKPKPVEIRIIDPKILELGKENELKIIFKSNVESLNEFRLRILSENLEVSYPETVTIGGKGNILEVPIKIKPTSYKAKIAIEVYGIDGSLVFSETKEIKVKIGMEVIYRYVIKVLMILLLIILGIILYYYLEARKKKKRRIEKAE
ncbi:MAG: hypothetical protein QXW13_01825 [Nanopusillaceae archaeon]